MRHEERIVIGEDGGRDQGKVFIITEMPATVGERWAYKLLSLLKKSGVNLPQPESDDEGRPGMQELAAQISTEQGIAFMEVLQDPALDAWWDCVKYQHASNQLPMSIKRDAEDCPIEEIGTVMQLRMAVLAMHTGFFSPAKASTSESPSPPTIPTGSSPTRMSRHRSAQSFPPGSRR